MPKSFLFLLAGTLMALPCFGVAGIPDSALSTAVIAYPGPGVPSLLVVPDGTGPGFTAARDASGNTVDATITLTLRDGLGYTIPNYPFEDLWVDALDGGLATCHYGVVSDANTDMNGVTQWTNPPFAGGTSSGPVMVYIAAMPLTSMTGLPLKFNSPDINGDLAVNLQDVSILSQDFYGSYNFRSDLNGDGVVNLQDVPLLAQHYGAQCP